MNCRFCRNGLNHIFIDLIASPPSNSFLTKEKLAEPEVYYPLKVFVCENCFLVQIDEHKKHSEIFCDEYVYFSSMSRTWLDHSKKYSGMIIEKLGLNDTSFVIEIASNDGYLLQFFKKYNIPCLGIEPTKSTADVARQKGITVLEEFFNQNLAIKLRDKGKRADLIIGNNVLAHVPNLNDFVEGLKIALKSTGTITLEFPHLFQLINNNQFDTIYHEHYSYFSLMTAQKIFTAHDLVLYNVEELDTHGGSLRIYVCHKENDKISINPSVDNLLAKEKKAGLDMLEYYSDFHCRVIKIKTDLTNFLINKKNKGKKIAGYGAAAKGNTLLNYCGIKNDIIDFVADAAPSKQGCYLPGSHIPVVEEKVITKEKPDYIIIFPWNIKSEIIEQLSYIKEWKGKFVVPIPELQIL
ncbi:MAG: methyltransferase domain-containing protein [Promethearchaeota archaeon]